MSTPPFPVPSFFAAVPTSSTSSTNSYQYPRSQRAYYAAPAASTTISQLPYSSGQRTTPSLAENLYRNLGHPIKREPPQYPDVYNILRHNFGQLEGPADKRSEILSPNDKLIVHPEPRRNRFRLIYCPSVLFSNGADIHIIEYTNPSPFSLAGRTFPSMRSEGSVDIAKWAVVNHEAGAAGSLRQSMLLLACLAAERRGLLWLWLDKICVMSSDTIPENCFGEAYMGAAAVLSFPGPQGLMELAPLSTRTHAGSLLWCPYTFISLFVHSTRNTMSKNNHWIIHHWRWEDSKYSSEALAEKYPGWIVYDYWPKCNVQAFETKPDYSLRQLLYLMDGSAMTNIQVLMEDEAYGFNCHPPGSKGMSLWRGYVHRYDPEQRKEPRILCNISAPQIIAFGSSQSTPVQSAPDAVIKIGHVINTYSQLLEARKRKQSQRQQVQDLLDNLTMQVWDTFTLFEPNYPASLTQVIAWTFGYIYNDSSINHDVISDLANVLKLSHHTWPINGPPYVLHRSPAARRERRWDTRFLAGSETRQYKIPVYLRRLHNMADHTMYEDFQYILEITSSGFDAHTAPLALRWIIKGRAMPLQETQDNIPHSKQPLLLYHWPKSESDSCGVSRVAVFAAYYHRRQQDHPQYSDRNDNYPLGNDKVKFEQLVILRKNKGSDSWYNERLGILQVTEEQDYSRSAPHKEFEIEVLVPSKATVSGAGRECSTCM